MTISPPIPLSLHGIKCHSSTVVCQVVKTNAELCDSMGHGIFISVVQDVQHLYFTGALSDFLQFFLSKMSRYDEEDSCYVTPSRNVDSSKVCHMRCKLVFTCAP